MKRNIVIYRDEGVGEFGLQCLQKFFRDDDVWLANAEAIVDGRVLGLADIFVMPGGADLPYCEKLNGAGNDNIRAYVEEGGTYLGICAGAYYACRRIEFHKGREDEICGNRELAFTKAVARGSLPALAPYYDLTLSTAAIASISLADGGQVSAFYHGGPAFIGAGSRDEIIARYSDVEGSPIAILKTSVGDGQAILCGIHPEVSAEDFADYPFKDEAEKNYLPAFKDGLSKNQNAAAILLKSLLEKNS